MGDNSRKYGLQMKQSKKTQLEKVNVFSESDTSSNLEKAFNMTERSAMSSYTLRQSRQELEKAYNEDPTVFLYDEVYERMEEVKESNDPRRNASKEPKYMNSLLQSAAFKRREWERRLEKKLQKDRESEGNDFADTESFVTDGYMKKLEEREEEDEMLRKQEEIDANNDVRNQHDMTHFYRNLLNRGMTSASTSSGLLNKENESGRKLKSLNPVNELKPSIEAPSVGKEMSFSESNKCRSENEPSSPKQVCTDRNVSDDQLTETVQQIHDPLKIFLKRNTTETIEAARTRYMDRKYQNILSHIVAASDDF